MDKFSANFSLPFYKHFSGVSADSKFTFISILASPISEADIDSYNENFSSCNKSPTFKATLLNIIVLF